MGFARRSAVAVLALAVAIAAVARFQPTLFLRIPALGGVPVGALLWTAATGRHMPPYLDMSCFSHEGMQDWIRAGDVFVSVGAKSGTNWMLYLSHLIRVKGDIETYPFVEVMATTPWFALMQYPGQTCKEVIAQYHNASHVSSDGIPLKATWDNPAFPFRVFKAHETPAGAPGGILPVDSMPGVKFVAMARPPEDVIRSFYTFFADHEDHVRATWGGCPPVYPSAAAALADLLPSGPLGPLVIPYVAGWWSFRDRPNVLLLHYDEAVRDLPGVVARLAAFLDVALTPAELARIAELGSFKAMKKVARQFDYRYFLHPTNDTLTIMRPGKLLRSGNSGEGSKDFFTPAQLAEIRAAAKAGLPADAFEWLYRYQTKPTAA